MARKRKKKTRRKKSSALSPALVLAQVKKDFENERFAEAIKRLRNIPQQERTEDWPELLQLSYCSRIGQLVGKNMIKEALFLYGNMVRFTGYENPFLQAGLFVVCGKYREALELFQEKSGCLGEAEKARFEEIIICTILGEDEPEKNGLFREDSAIGKYFLPAVRAFSYFVGGDLIQAGEQLKLIPLRSPYKNFLLALKGMILREKDPQSACKILRRVEKGSPFRAWADPCLHQSGHEEKDMDEKSVSPSVFAARALMAGMDVKQFKFISELESFSGGPGALYSFLVRNKNMFSNRLLEKACGRLVLHAPDKAEDFQRRFEAVVEPFEAHRQVALLCENAYDYSPAIELWLKGVKILEDGGPDNRKKIAMIYRRCAKLCGYEYMTIDDFCEGMYLRKALEYDPDNKDIYLELINKCEKGSSEQYKIINELYRLFPDDLEVMEVMMDGALRRGAYKKAGSIAAKLLKADPVNRSLRIKLIEAHLSHALKLVKKRKYELAAKECDLAEKYERSNLVHGRIDLFKGCIEILAGREKSGLELIDRGIGGCGSDIPGSFQASVVAGLMALPAKLVKAVDSRLRKAIKTAPEKDVLLHLRHHLEEMADSEVVRDKSVSIIAPWLKKGSRLDLEKEELLRFCELFYRLQNYPLLETYGKQAMKKDKSGIVYFYYIYGKSWGGGKAISEKEHHKLVDALEDAERQEDMRLANMIDDLLYALEDEDDFELPDFSFLRQLGAELEKKKAENKKQSKQLKLFE